MAAASGRAAAASSPATAVQVLGDLPPTGWRVFHDLGWPGRPRTRIDHVVIGPQGVFVVAQNTWPGEVQVDGTVLRVDGHRRTTSAHEAADAAAAVSEVLTGLDPAAVLPVVCFVRAEPVFGWVEDVMLCSTQNIVTMLTSRPHVLGETVVQQTAEALARALVPAPAASSWTSPMGRARAEQTSRRRRIRGAGGRGARGGSRRKVLLAGVLVALALAFSQVGWPALMNSIGPDGITGILRPATPIGEPVTVTGLGTRPPLTLTVGRPVVTRSTTQGVKVERGHRLLAVPLTVRNTGSTRWVSVGTSALVYDAEQSAYPVAPGFTKVRAGRVLKEVVTLDPGQLTTGMMIFDVPAGPAITKVELTIGPGVPKTVRWALD